jgi:GNAT superfamily N-acetyltransferase
MAAERTPHPYVSARFEHQLELVRPSRARVNPPATPDGYTLRQFADADETAYEELFHLAWPDEGTLTHTRAHALPLGFFVVEHDDTSQLVGSCVAFSPETASHAADGSLGWLVVDAAHGGHGIGSVLAATVTNRLLDQEYEMPWLGTEDGRLVAIDIYLALGWRPSLYVDGMEQRWRAIFAELGRTFTVSECVA